MKSSNISKRIFISSGKVIFFQVLGILLGFALQALVSNTCGAAGLGGFTLFVSWLGILSALTVPGMEGTLVYFLPRYENDPENRRKVVQVGLIVVGSISVLFAGLLLAGSDGLLASTGLPPGAKIPFSVTVILFSLGKLLDSVLLGMKDAPAIGYFNVIRTILRLLFCLPIFLFPGSTWNVLFLALVCECALTLLLRYLRIQKNHPEVLGAKRGESVALPLRGSQIAAITFPMFGIGIIGTLYPYLDKAVLGAMLPISMVGVYKVSESIASLNSFFVAPFITFWPYISKLYSENKLNELRDAYRNITLVIIALMVPFVLAMIEVSSYLFSLFGAVFVQQGKIVYLILIFGFIVDALAGPAGSVLKMTRYSRVSLAITMTLLLVYLVLSLALTRSYGLIGAAVARTVVMVLENVANVTANHLLLGIFPYTRQHVCLLGSGIMVFLLRFLMPTPAIGHGMHFLIAGGEVVLFSLMAALILRSKFDQIRRFGGDLIRTRNV